MQYKDEFDGPDFMGTVKSIFGSLNRRERVGPRRPVFAVAIVGVLLVFLLGVLWYSYPRGGDEKESGAVPIIRADAGPIKVIPSDPGGMDIPHRDSTVFETLRAGRDSDSGERHVENLLGEPEEPLERGEIFAGLKAEVKVEGRTVISAPEGDSLDITEEAPLTIAQTEEAVEEENVAVVEEAEPVVTEEIELAAAPGMVVPTSKPEKEIAEEISRTEPAAGVETFEANGGGWYAQVAAVSSNDAAEAAWKDIQKKVSVLKTLEHRIQKADLGAKGIYYRVQAGPLSEARAREICAAVTAQKAGGCLAVKN